MRELSPAMDFVFVLNRRLMAAITVGSLGVFAAAGVSAGDPGAAPLEAPIRKAVQRPAYALGEAIRTEESPSANSVSSAEPKPGLAEVLDRVARLRDSDVDWEWTPRGKVRPALPVDIAPLREFYDDPEVEKKLVELLKGPETLVVGLILIREATQRFHCVAIRQPYGFEANCGGLTVRVKVADGPIIMKTIEYPKLDWQRSILIEYWPQQLKERSIAAHRKEPVADGWTNEAKSWLEERLSNEGTTDDPLDKTVEAAFADLLDAGVRWVPTSIGSAAPATFREWKTLDVIKSGGRGSIDRLLELLDQDESCIPAHLMLTRLHADSDILHFWYGPPYDGQFPQELNYNGLTVVIRGFRSKDWVVTYPRFDIEKHALRHYWSSLCEKRDWPPERSLAD